MWLHTHTHTHVMLQLHIMLYIQPPHTCLHIKSALTYSVCTLHAVKDLVWGHTCAHTNKPAKLCLDWEVIKGVFN